MATARGQQADTEGKMNMFTTTRSQPIFLRNEEGLVKTTRGQQIALVYKNLVRTTKGQ